MEMLEDRTLLSVNFGWALGLGSTSTDYGRGIATDAGGNAYVTGSFNGTVDFDPGPGTVNLTNDSGIIDGFIAKYSPTGGLVWATDLNTPGSSGIAVSGSDVYVFNAASISPARGVVKLDTASGTIAWRNTDLAGVRGIAADPTGFVYITGVSTLNSYSYVAKLDPASGGVLWSVTTSAGANAIGIAVDGAGNAYVTGSYSGTVDFDPGPGTFNLTATTSAQNGGDIFIWKLDASGAFVWAGSMGGNGVDNGQGIGLDGTGNVYVTGDWGSGQSSMNNDDFDPGPGTLALTNNRSSADIFVVKLAPNAADGGRSLNLVWAESLGGSDYDSAKALALDGSGSVYLTGNFASTADFDPSNHNFNLTSAGGQDIFVCQLRTADGSLVTAARMGSAAGSDFGNDIAVDTSGNVYTTGQFENTADFDPGPGTYNLTSAGGIDAFISKLTLSSTSSPPAISINDVTITEGNSGITYLVFTVSLSAVSDQPVSVNYATADGTAKVSDKDYVATSGTLTFAPGEWSKTILIQIKGDRKKEANEAFFLNLSQAVNAVFADSQGLGTILNDD